MPLIQLKEATTRSFDYVIVGGGTAGLTLAARLTENPEISVLVLEAGEENLNDSLIMHLGQYGHNLGRKEYDWCAKSIPQVRAGNAEIHMSRGRVLGGSSAVNFFAWNKPSREDIDAWEKLGNRGWNWDRFDKYMQRAMTYTPPDLAEAEHARRGTPQVVRKLWQKPIGNGPVQVSHPPQRLNIDIKVEHTFHELGIPFAPAPLTGNPNGIVIGPMSVDPKTVQRSFAANEYWKPNAERPNFKLLTGVLAHRLISTESGDGLKITGVEFSHKDSGEQIYVVGVSREAIICTGALKTPQILELSGIGRPEVLEKAGIQVQLPLEGVGENVQEHINTSLVFKLRDDISDETYDSLRTAGGPEKHMKLFAQQEGLYAAGFSSFAFVPLSVLSDRAHEIISKARNRIESEISAGKYPPGLVDQYRILLDNLEKGVPSCEVIGFPGYFGPAPPQHGKFCTLISALNGTFSRGTIHVANSDPSAEPVIDPQYFGQGIDFELLLEVTEFGKKVGRTAPFKDYLDENSSQPIPGSGANSDGELIDYVRSHTISTSHTVGSASMLPQEKGGVVDTNLKVYGTKNLRIADLSIVPLHFGSHSQPVAYGIGEIAADIIKVVA